jgi:hypothetical protein
MLRFAIPLLTLLAAAHTAFAQCTESNPSGCDISPAAVEVNIAAVPLDHYLDRDNLDQNNNIILKVCPSATPIRTCVVNILKGYKAEGATGLRFMFGFGKAAYSTVWNTDGTINRKWANNLDAFYSDVARVGLSNIIPTPNTHGWWGPSEEFWDDQEVTGCAGTVTLRFLKWNPFGLELFDENDPPTPNDTSDDTVGLAECFEDNEGYDNGADNPIFWGWQPFFRLVDTLLAKAVARGLVVKEIDISNEIDLVNWPIVARYIYDNQTNTPQEERHVIAKVQTMLEDYFGTGAGGRVTFSTQALSPFDPDAATADDVDETMTAESFNCGSVYGDAAQIIGQSELTAAYAGGLIGFPDRLWETAQYGLACEGYMTDMFTFPVSSTQPTANDFHAYVCIANPCFNGYETPNPNCSSYQTNYCIDPGSAKILEAGNWPTDFGAATARILFDEIWTFLDNRNFEDHKAIMGELNGAQAAHCDGVPDLSIAFSTVNGFNGYDGSSSLLYTNSASNTSLVPWENMGVPSCWVMPNDINPPYSP